MDPRVASQRFVPRDPGILSMSSLCGLWHDAEVQARPEREDAEPGRLILAGDTDLFTEIVNRYKTRLWRFIERYTNDAEDARDVTQDVFLKVYGALDSYDPAYKFSTWLFRIAGNAAIDH